MATTSQNPAANSPQRLGGFELLDKIGEGGMGIVYRARQLSLDRIVALKVLSHRVADDPKYTDSFLREAKAAARLNHPNIIHVYDAGKADSRYYYAMEFVRGETLAQWVYREGALPELLVLDIAICVASALKNAWDSTQIIHRDIKPENVMVDEQGNVRVCDLGLAKNFGENTMLSLSGQAFGTPNYMSPEQARAERTVDFRSDIYSFGLTMYFTLTGKIPFQGGTPGLIMGKQLTEQLPDPREHVPHLSSHVCLMLEKMTAKEADDRYQSWDDVLRDLHLVKADQPPHIPASLKGQSSIKRATDWGARNQVMAGSRPSVVSVPAPPSKARSALYVASGIFLLVLLGAIAWFVLGKNAAPPHQQNPNPPPAIIPAVATRDTEAQKMLDEILARSKANPSQQAQLTIELQNLIAQFPNSHAATEARRLLATLRASPPNTTIQPPTVGGTSTPSAIVIPPTPPEDKVKQEEERKRAEQRMREESERAKMLTAFSDFQKSFLSLLAKRDYTAAEKLATQAAANPAFASLKERAIAFGEVAKRLNNFHASLPDTLALLKGKDISAQGQTGVLVEVKSGVLELERRIGDAGAVGFSVPIAKLSIEEIASLTAAAKPSAVAGARLDIAWILFAEGKSGEAGAQLDAAQKAGANVASARQTMEWLSNRLLKKWF